MSNVGIIQGKVLELRDEQSERNFTFAFVRLQLPNGLDQQFHSRKSEVNFEVGDVIRGIAAGVRKDIRDSLSLVNKDGIEHPSLFNVSNLGKVDVSTTQKSHYEFGEKLSGKIVEDLGSCFALDEEFYFAKIQLRDGSFVKITLPGRRVQIGSEIEGTVGNSVFSSDGDQKGSPSGLHSAGFGNLGGMTLLFDVRSVPAPRSQNNFSQNSHH